MEEFDKKIRYLAHKKPDKVEEIIKEVYKHSPEKISHLLEHYSEGDHITQKEEYDKCVKKLKWIDNRGNGAKWEFSEIVRQAEKLANIDFKEVEYTEYDFAYLVNMLYAIFCKIYSDSSTYLKMAKQIFDYSKVDEEQYGAFFKPIKQNDKYKTNSEYENRYENRYDNRYEDYDSRYGSEYRLYNRMYDDDEEARRRRRYRSESDRYEEDRRY